MTRNKFGILGILLGGLLVAGCEENGLSPQSNSDILDETAFVENALASVTEDADDVVDNSSGGRFRPKGIGVGHGPGFGWLDCALVEESEEGVYPQTISVDYGDGCESFRGMTKSGKMIITITGDLEAAGSQRIQTFEDFAVNGNQIEGTRTFTNLGNGSFTTMMQGGKITTPDGQLLTRESTRTRTLISGLDTDDRADDVYQITGSSSGTNSNGNSYSKSISSPLVRSRDCRWIVSGVVDTQVEGEATVTVGFGDGTCDAIAMRTENGITEEFTMDFRMKMFGRQGR